MATIAAASGSQADVQTAITAASSGDTVTIPADEETWTGLITVPDAKTLIIQGAGSGATIINDGGFDIGTSGSRITAIGFSVLNRDTNIDSEGYNCRIDHCSFTSVTFKTKIMFRKQSPGLSAPVGLVDNCTLHNGRVLCNGSTTLLNCAPWFEVTGLGTNNAVFVEDCTFTSDVQPSNAVDGNYGGRFVFRYNTLTDTYIEAHSIKAVARAIRSWEIYENTLARGDYVGYIRPFLLRGGTGVCFNNTITGTWSTSTIHIDNARSNTNPRVDYANPPGNADGNPPDDSDWDGNTAGEAGWPARDQIGRGIDASLFVLDSTPYPSQASDPAYFWDNTYGGAAMGVSAVNGSDHHIQADRDYYTSEKSGYTSYTYPHPLRGEVPHRNKMRFF